VVPVLASAIVSDGVKRTILVGVTALAVYTHKPVNG